MHVSAGADPSTTSQSAHNLESLSPSSVTHYVRRDQIESMCREVESASVDHWRWLLRQEDEQVLRKGPLSVFKIRTCSHHMVSLRLVLRLFVESSSVSEHC
jgi:hypothetical protein